MDEMKEAIRNAFEHFGAGDLCAKIRSSIVGRCEKRIVASAHFENP
ncbi:MAG: hypothetical protein GY820_21725 [Gammaproteobacteria bacterium]|nr:hypothetical protein [Gammaproteobacteria bacterium]